MRLRVLGASLFALIVAYGHQNCPRLAQATAQVPAGSLPLRTVASVPLPGGSSRFDYQSLDEQQHLLFIAHLGAGLIHVVDTRSQRVIATRTNRQLDSIALGGEAGNTQYDPVSHRIFVDVQTRNQLVAIDPRTDRIVARYPLPGCDHDHGLLIDPAQRLAFVTCDGDARLLAVNMRTFRVLSLHSVGADPDVLAFDSGLRRLYVAAESGVVSIFREQGRSLVKLGQAFVAPEAHSIAVDTRTHRIYLPLQGTHNQPVLRIMAALGAR